LPASFFYVLSLFLFALGLMSKPMLVTVPFVLLLLDYWPLRRFELKTLDSTLKTLVPLVLEKLPFFLFSLLSCFITVLAQRQAIQPLANLSVGARVGNAVVAYVRYLGKTFWPLNLATPYPHPGHWPLASVLLAAALLAALTLAALWSSRRDPFVFTGWFWFLGTLVPVIGFLQVGEQSMADRYTYLPLIGIFIILAWSVRFRTPEPHARIRVDQAIDESPLTPALSPSEGERGNRRQFSGLMFAAAAVVLLACAARTRDQLRCWHDSESLYRHAVAVSSKNFIAYYNLGSWLDSEGRIDAALTNYLKAVEMQPHYPDPLNNIGCILAGRKQFTDAIPYFEAALRSKPDFTSARENLANSLRELKRFDEAIPQLRRVVRDKPDDIVALNSLANELADQGQYAEALPYYEASLRAKPEQPGAHYGLGNALGRLRRNAEAMQQYRLAVEQKPDFCPARYELGIALAREGRPDEALVQLREAVRLEPNNPVFLLNLAKVLAARQSFAEAIPVFTEALRHSPNNPAAHNALGAALASTARLDEAIAQFQEALRLRPEDASAHFNLGKALAAQGKIEEAIRHFTEALRLKPDFAAAQQELQALAARKPQ
jgi:tetratricopeptide (TPR) repeat protein